MQTKPLHILLVFYTALFLSGFFVVLGPVLSSNDVPIGENCCCAGVTMTECNCSGDCHHGEESDTDYPALQNWPCSTVFNQVEMIQFPKYIPSAEYVPHVKMTTDIFYLSHHTVFQTQHIPELPDKPPTAC